MTRSHSKCQPGSRWALFDRRYVVIEQQAFGMVLLAVDGHEREPDRRWLRVLPQRDFLRLAHRLPDRVAEETTT